MRTIYVVTHAEATHHVERLVGGWYDSELTSTGRHAAIAIAASLRARIPADADVELYSSDLRRTMQTADAVSATLGVRPLADRRLREKSYGDAEGKPAGTDPRFTPPPPTGDRMGHDDGVPGAETKAAFARRIYAAMDTILASRCQQQIIVTHGLAITFVVAAWIRMPSESAGYVSFRAAPGSITVLHEDDYFHNRQLTSLGDTSHLVGTADQQRP